MTLNIQNIDKYKKAIDLTGDLSKGQKDILKYIISFDQIKGVTTDAIQQISGISRQAASVHLQRLMKSGFVYREKKRIYKYFVNEQKLGEILLEFLTIQNLKNQ
jgi:predicted transcriptional regulator